MKRLAIILALLLSTPVWAQFPPQGVLLPSGGGGGGGGGGSGTVLLGNPGNIAYYPSASTQVGPATGTAHGVFLYEAPNTPTTTGVGTTGQVLTGINSSDPIWATPDGDISETSVAGNNISFTVARVNGAVPGGTCSGATPFVASLNSQAIPTCMPSTTSPSFRAFTLLGATSGSDSIGVPAIAGTGTVFNFPANNGTNGYALTTDGSGNTAWTSIAGSGTVTQLNQGTGMTLTPSPITGVGTIALTVPVVAANGGTGVSNPTAHAVAVSEGSSPFASVACGANAVLTGVASADPACTVTPQLGIAGTSTGTLGLASGSGAGVVTIKPNSATGTYNFNLPTAAGTLGQPLLSGGGGSTAQSYGTLAVGGGGTGVTSGTSGGVPYFASSSTMASSAALTANQPVIGGGAGSAPTVGSKSGNTNVFATMSGSIANGDCWQSDSNGNAVDSGAPCGGGGGGGPNTTPTVIIGTTAGTATCYTPWQSVSLGEVRCKLVGYENTTVTPQTYTYNGGYTFGIAPVFDQNIVPLASASTTTLSLPANMLAPVTGYIVLVGTQ